MTQAELSRILSLIDLTQLTDSDTNDSIKALCQKAVTPLGAVAAVCVYSRFVPVAVKSLNHSHVKIAAVANFPSGNENLDDTLALIRQSIDYGANEIDVVFPHQAYLRGEKTQSYDYIRACKEASGESVILKVILETGALLEKSIIEEVSYHLCYSGADFLKTSTGKIFPGATLDAAEAMLTIIKKIPRPVGIKISGGVRTLDDAMSYVALAERVMGKNWVTPAHFRLGSSQLVDAVSIGSL